MNARDNAKPSSPGRVVVTGGASGLGAAIVEAIADHGGEPIVLDRTAVGRSGVAERTVDVTDAAAVEEAIDSIARSLGGIDALVTAAGIDSPGALDTVPTEMWNRVVDVNLFGTANAVRAALPHLKKSHGRVVTVASSLGIKAVGDATAYCASKFGVMGFTRALAAETRGQVGVTTLVPGGMKTHFFDGRDEQYKPGDDAALNDPRDVAAAALFALTQPAHSQIRELVVCHEAEPSWP